MLVTNGPGELSTWVRPLAERLHAQLALRPRHSEAPLALRLVLVPCPNATGQEARVAAGWGLFERVLPASRFWWLLLRPQRHGPWPRQGVVVFLGGDQFWTVLLSARLGYRHVTYAEWVVRWPGWNDSIAVMGPAAAGRLPARWRPRAVEVGDLMADLSDSARRSAPLPSGEWVGAILPEEIAAEAADWLKHPERLAGMRDDLRQLRGRPGAVEALAEMVQRLLPAAADQLRSS